MWLFFNWFSHLIPIHRRGRGLIHRVILAPLREAMLAAANSIWDTNSESDSEFSDTVPVRPRVSYADLYAARRNKEPSSTTIAEGPRRLVKPDEWHSSCSFEYLKYLPEKHPAREAAPGKRKRIDGSSQQEPAAGKHSRRRTALTGNVSAEASLHNT